MCNNWNGYSTLKHLAFRNGVASDDYLGNVAGILSLFGGGGVASGAAGGTGGARRGSGGAGRGGGC